MITLLRVVCWLPAMAIKKRIVTKLKTNKRIYFNSALSAGMYGLPIDLTTSEMLWFWYVKRPPVEQLLHGCYIHLIHNCSLKLYVHA